jgi:hypothetical protein
MDRYFRISDEFEGSNFKPILLREQGSTYAKSTPTGRKKDSSLVDYLMGDYNIKELTEIDARRQHKSRRIE